MNKRIVILGAGESGTGAAILAKRKGYDVFVSDKNAISEPFRSRLEEENIPFEENKHSLDKILNAREVIKSPGISPEVPVVMELLKKNIPVIDELEFASRFTQAKLILITGTNGKTTTTLLTYHLLKVAGLSVGLAGNVGQSLASQLLQGDKDYFVIEISSYQLDGLRNLYPHIGILLNITPDHLDRYKTFENYLRSKASLMGLMNNQSTLVYFAEDNQVMQAVQSHSHEFKKFAIGIDNPQNKDGWSDEQALNVNLEGLLYQVDWNETSLVGTHNKINTLAAMAVALMCGCSMDKLTEGLKSFVNAPHRLEYITNIGEVTYINDSKATNLDSVKYALESFSKPLVWIAGGIDKGNDYSLIKDLVAEKVRALICLGIDNEKLKESFGSVLPSVSETKSMKEAVHTAHRISEKNNIVLLSPACASFDLFKNYMDRGDIFRNEVLQLKKELEGNAI
ncbi:MAG: UDP-N-acetylmuramoyl-L-alanine--D-glutamate ligase [Cyclobacteriaceae bacterium]|nr:UDP-N-acetylmuramoyl-L-alanine--D-glutamate ligase [Cyclobacteriaceae bacterium]